MSTFVIYLQAGITTPLGCFRDWSKFPAACTVLTTAISSSFYLCVSFLSLPLLRLPEMRNSNSVLKMSGSECSLLDGDVTVLRFSQVFHNIAPCDAISIKAVLVRNCFVR